MTRRRVRNERAFIARRCAPVLLLLLTFLVVAPPSRAQTDLGPVTVGAGLRTSFEHTEPDSGTSTNQFELNDIRLYVNGTVTKNIKFMFNTEYDSITNKVGVLDAVAQFSTSPEFNVWVGRFLPPSDRANLYGPFYAHEWKVFTDGIQDGYPGIFQGRDNGAMYYGTFAKKVKVSGGVFDGQSATGNSKILGAARVQIDFWDPEDGYYLNGTYYGDKNLLAIGGATQVQDGHTGSSADFLLERKLPNYAKSQGAYGLGSYLFPKKVGIGQFEILGKYAKAEFTHGIGVTPGANPNYDQKTTEINFNYIIKQFNARVMTFYENTRFNRLHPNFWQAGVGLQIQI
jgi:hypothetical protein